MKYFYTTLLLLAACAGQKSDFDLNGNSDNTKDYNRNEDFYGNWKLIQKEMVEEKQSTTAYHEMVNPNIATEWTPPVYLNENGTLTPYSPKEYLAIENSYLNLTSDSIYWINYPIQITQQSHCKIDSNKIYIGGNTVGRQSSLSANKDTLVISYVDGFGIFIKETYLKTSFNAEILAILSKYQTNFPELAGTWHLIREEDGEYGERYELDFPHTLPDSIFLSRVELESTLHTDRSVQMLTDGKKLKYYLGYKKGELVLTPGKWYNGEDSQVYFEQLED